jgi:hypothetical protein
MSRLRIRPLTVLLILVAIVALVAAVIYFTRSAYQLPSFFPGHAPHSKLHHVKSGAALTVLAVLALFAASFTTGRGGDNDADDDTPAHDVWGGPLSSS